MAPFVCCGFRRAHSPDDTPVRPVDNVDHRFTLSSTPPSSSLDECKPIREKSSTNFQQSIPLVNSHHRSGHDHDFNVRRKDSIKRLQAAVRGVKRKFSRDSEASVETSNQALRSMMSADDVNKRKERKYALRSHFGSEVIDDRSEIYDEDAIPIKTPKGTWPCQHESIQTGPGHLRGAMVRSSPPLPPATKEFDGPNLVHPQPQVAKARALSRMLTARGSRLTDESTQSDVHYGGSAVEAVEISNEMPPKKYVFTDDNLSPAGTRTSSPLGTAETLSHTASDAAPTKGRLPMFLNAVSDPAAPGLNPTCLASISDSIAGNDWRLSFSDNRKVSLVPKFDAGEERTEDQQPDSPTSQSTSNKAPWLRGASGSLASSPLTMPGSWLHESCDPGREEGKYSGVDGKDSPPLTRARSDGSDPASVHLYDMHISQRLASYGIVTAALSPRLKSESLSDRSWAFGMENLSLAPRHQASSSGFDNSKTASAWVPTGEPAASSVYTMNSGPQSSASSQAALPQAAVNQPPQLIAAERPTSRQRFMMLDSLTHKQANASTDTWNEPRIDRLSTPLQAIHMDGLDLRPLSAISSTPSKSQTPRGIEAAGADSFSRRSHRVAQNRCFSQAELDELTHKIALRRPPRRGSLSRFDGSSEGSSSSKRLPEVSGVPWKPSDMAGVEPAEISVWEKALRDHVKEDIRLANLDPGSVTTDGSKSYNGVDPTDRQHQSSLRHAHSSSEEWDENLQARLGIYELALQNDKAPCPIGACAGTVLSSESSFWSQFPSHCRKERSATDKDNVLARDFAPRPGMKVVRTRQKHRRDSVRRVHSAHFDRLRYSLKDIYRAKSMEFSSKFAIGSRGHRSSISVGRLAEYPELEMVQSLSPPDTSGDGSFSWDVHSVQAQYGEYRQRDKHRSTSPRLRNQVSPAGSARKWSRLYDDCVFRDTSDGSHRSGVVRYSDDDVRSSTLEFKRGVENSEQKEREKVLRLRTRVEE
ncbi:MAG: hypothetical protein Q9163_004218 [Psora crenata]